MLVEASFHRSIIHLIREDAISAHNQHAGKLLPLLAEINIISGTAP